MAAAIWVVEASLNGGSVPVRDGLVSVIINVDSAASAATVRAAAVARAVAGGHNIPANYFDGGNAPYRIDDLVAGPLKDTNDAYVVTPRLVAKVESTA